MQCILKVIIPNAPKSQKGNNKFSTFFASTLLFAQFRSYKRQKMNSTHVVIISCWNCCLVPHPERLCLFILSSLLAVKLLFPQADNISNCWLTASLPAWLSAASSKDVACYFIRSSSYWTTLFSFCRHSISTAHYSYPYKQGRTMV